MAESAQLRLAADEAATWVAESTQLCWTADEAATKGRTESEGDRARMWMRMIMT